MKEIDLIKTIRKRAGKLPKEVVRGIGDDCAVINIGGKDYLLWAQDMLVEDTHFDLKREGYKDVGRKAVAVNLSDIAAMGGSPEYIQVSLGVPAGTPVSALKALYDGIFSVSGEFGVKLLGGDTNKSDKLVIDVSIIGKAPKKNITFRSGARPGDVILITGPVRDGKKEHLSFVPRVREAKRLTVRYKINAMIDTSDGIAPDIIRVCEESGTGCMLYEDAIPLSEGLALDDAMYYGESFELLFAMSPEKARRMFIDIGRSGKAPGCFIIGEMTGKKSQRVIIGKEGKVTKLRMDGYRHL